MRCYLRYKRKKKATVTEDMVRSTISSVLGLTMVDMVIRYHYSFDNSKYMVQFSKKLDVENLVKKWTVGIPQNTSKDGNPCLNLTRPR